MMKKSFTLVLLICICIEGYSQKKSFGLKAGITSAYLRFRGGGEALEAQKTGFFAGGIAQFQLAKKIAFQPNLLVALKGGQLEHLEFTTWHIEIPLNLLYTEGGFFVGAGPNFSYGLDGKLKGELVQPDGEADIYSVSEIPDFTFKRVEIGANVLMGYTFQNGISLSANFTHGLNNLRKNFDNFSIYSKTFGFAAGYMFGKKK